MTLLHGVTYDRELQMRVTEIHWKIVIQRERCNNQCWNGWNHLSTMYLLSPSVWGRWNEQLDCQREKGFSVALCGTPGTWWCLKVLLCITSTLGGGWESLSMMHPPLWAYWFSWHWWNYPCCPSTRWQRKLQCLPQTATSIPWKETGVRGFPSSWSPPASPCSRR